LSNSCQSDEDCDDNDSSTSDKCLSEVSTCLYQFKECDEYGQVVYIDVLLMTVSYPPYFELTDEHGVIKLQGGPYFNADTPYQSKVCLGDGTYELKMSSKGSLGTYKVYLNDETKYTFLASGSFGYYDENIEEVFEVRKPSSYPSQFILSIIIMMTTMMMIIMMMMLLLTKPHGR